MAKTATRDQAGQQPAPQAETQPQAGQGEAARRAPRLVSLISTLEGGHRRSGIRFGKAPVEVDLATLDDGQIEALQNDPHIRPARPTPAAEADEA